MDTLVLSLVVYIVKNGLDVAHIYLNVVSMRQVVFKIFTSASSLNLGIYPYLSSEGSYKPALRSSLVRAFTVRTHKVGPKMRVNDYIQVSRLSYLLQRNVYERLFANAKNTKSYEIVAKQIF